MPEREQKKKPNAKQRTEEVEDLESAPSEKGEALKEELDDLLDEIDSVLEANAEDFVRSYIQKGGE